MVIELDENAIRGKLADYTSACPADGSRFVIRHRTVS
jgi:hypothetical protein